MLVVDSVLPSFHFRECFWGVNKCNIFRWCFSSAKHFLIKFLPDQINLSEIDQSADFKTQLQEIIQQNSDKKIEYVLNKESGPDHDKLFTIDLKLNSKVISQGTGKSKKRAEQEAAKKALELLEK